MAVLVIAQDVYQVNTFGTGPMLRMNTERDAPIGSEVFYRGEAWILSEVEEEGDHFIWWLEPKPEYAVPGYFTVMDAKEIEETQ